MKKKLNITVLVDEAEIPAGDPDFLTAPEKQTTEFHVIEALRALLHYVYIIHAGENMERLFV